MESGIDMKPRLADAASRVPTTGMPCIFCKKLWENRLTTINDKKEILGALEALGVKYEPIPGVCDYACYKCVYRINVIIDFRRLLERNINKTRANYYYTLGNKDLCRKYLVSNDANISNTVNIASNDGLSLLITDVRSEREPERTADFLFDCFNDPDMYSTQFTQDRTDTTINSPNHRLLEPLYVTEFAELNGGNSTDAKYKNYNNLLDRKYNYKCQFCTKTYKRLHYLKKHERKHRAKTAALHKDPNSSFECERCHQVLESKTLLKNHVKSHRSRMKCSYCSAEFYLRNDLEYHEARCYGEISAKDDTASVKTYYTRSRAKRRASLDESEMEVQSERKRIVDKWIEDVDPDQNYDEDDDDGGYSRFDDDNMSFVSNFSRATTAMTDATYQSEMSCSSYGTSYASTVISARIEKRVFYDKKLNRKLLATNSSVCGRPESRTRSEVNRTEQLKLLDDFICGKPGNVFNSSKWRKERTSVRRRIRALSKKTGEKPKMFYCNRPNCKYLDKSLVSMMRHDIAEHKMLPLYRCMQCGKRFTRENYLNVHQMDHEPRSRPCHLCNEPFNYSTELKAHLQLHSIRSHKCPTCPLSFIKESKLISHLKEFRHGKKSEGFKIEHYKLVDDANDTSSTPNNTTAKEPYKVFYRPQQPCPTRMKFEKVRWILGDLKNHEKANDLPSGLLVCSRDVRESSRSETDTDASEIQNDCTTPHTSDDGRCADGVAAERSDDDQPKILPVADISPNDDKVEGDNSPDLESLGLFSIESIGNGLDQDGEEKIETTGRTKSKRSSSNTLELPERQNSTDPILPSYTSIISEDKSKYKKMRILTGASAHLPSRIGTC